MTYIIIPIYNGLKHAQTFVRCLNNQTVEDITVVVVDNGSDGSGQWIFEHIQSIVIRGSSNLYWGSSLQLAYEYIADNLTVYDSVLIINIDRMLCSRCTNHCPANSLSADYIQNGLNHLQRGTMVVSAGHSVETRQHESGGLHVDWATFGFKVSDDVNIAGTTGLFMNGKDFANSGGFSRLLPHYWSDVEFVHRQIQNGLKLIAPKNLIIWMLNETGIDQPKNLKELFSIKSCQNPIYKSIFILKCSPIKYIPINLLRAIYWIWRVL